jgi:LmbE family N-acetylglucosaminyl deacetylase
MEKRKIVLAIGAHPDDIEIGCGGTIRKHIISGDDVCYVIASNGEMGGSKEERIEEAKQAARLMGVKEINFLSLEDTLISHDGKTIGLLDEVMCRVRPDIVYVHSLKDYHQDHMNTAKSILSASRKMRNSILCYEAPSTTLEFSPIAFNDVSNTFEIKMECINKFVSQAEKNYLERKALADLAKFRGKIINVEYAEAFEVLRLFEW